MNCEVLLRKPNKSLVTKVFWQPDCLMQRGVNSKRKEGNLCQYPHLLSPWRAERLSEEIFVSKTVTVHGTFTLQRIICFFSQTYLNHNWHLGGWTGKVGRTKVQSSQWCTDCVDHSTFCNDGEWFRRMEKMLLFKSKQTNSCSCYCLSDSYHVWPCFSKVVNTRKITVFIAHSPSPFL